MSREGATVLHTEASSARLRHGARQEMPAGRTALHGLLKMREASAPRPCSRYCGFGFVYKHSVWNLCRYADRERRVTAGV